MNLVMMLVEMFIVISSSFDLGLAGSSVAAAAFLALSLRLRLFLFCCSLVEALTCFSRLELDVAVKTLGAGVVSALAIYFWPR